MGNTWIVDFRHYLTPEGAMAKLPPRARILAEHFASIVLDATSEDGQRVLREFPAADRANTLFVVDPLGNLMMRYDARQNPRGLLEDLKKLLRLSQIG